MNEENIFEESILYRNAAGIIASLGVVTEQPIIKAAVTMTQDCIGDSVVDFTYHISEFINAKLRI